MFVGCVTIIVTIIFVAKSSTAQRDCPTPEGAQGTCIDIKNCASILKLVRESATLQDAEIDKLRKSLCGFEGNTPKVCCPKIAQETTTTKEEKISGSNSTLSTSPPDVSNHPNRGLINNRNCGVFTDTRIFGGNETRVLEFPWMALIAYKVNGQGTSQFGCGGSLISKRYVLTAAHCLTALGAGLELSGVRIGEHDISRQKDCYTEETITVCADKYQDFSIEKIHLHPEYVKITHKNDVALIRLDGDVDFTSSIKPICLPIINEAPLTSNKVIVTGWGTTETGLRSLVLLKVTLDVVPLEKCMKTYHEKNAVEVWYKQLCAGGKNRMDSCTGDSGGPLQVPGLVNGTPRYIQYGIVGFGPDGCGVVGYPGVYTRVDHYMDWILDMITE